jgi:hypothetical protein
MPSATMRTAVDSFVREARPKENFGADRILKVRGPGSNDGARIFIFFTRPFPRGANVFSATLRLTLAGAWGGTNGLVVRRITQPWAEDKVRWNAQPDVSDESITQTITNGTDLQEVEINLTTMMTSVSRGAAWYGFRLALNQNVLRKLYSGEANTVSRRPQLSIEWGQAPSPPSKLSPSAGQAVSETKPVLDWKFIDNRGDTTQAYSQVQIHSSNSWSAPLYDSGKVANSRSEWDTSATAWTGVAAGQTRWWRVRVWDGTNLVSNWSDPAKFTRAAKPTLTLVNPPAAPNNTVEDTTPPIDWTLSVAQERAEVVLWRLGAGGKVAETLKAWRDIGSETEVQVPNVKGKRLKRGQIYRVRVRSWDGVDRAVTPGDPDYLQVQRDFTYVRSGVPASPTGLTVTRVGPGIELTWQRVEQPDKWSLAVDDVEVDEWDADDSFVSGTTYRTRYWGLKPGHTAKVEIEAVRNDAGVHKHSSNNPTVNVTVPPDGCWIVDAATGNYIALVGGDMDPEFAIGESAATFYPIGSRSPVRLTDNVRGYEGEVSGTLVSRAARDTLLGMKEGFDEYRLVIGDLNIPITLEDVSVSPMHLPGGDKFSASVQFFQSGEFGQVIRWQS